MDAGDDFLGLSDEVEAVSGVAEQGSGVDDVGIGLSESYRRGALELAQLVGGVNGFDGAVDCWWRVEWGRFSIRASGAEEYFEAVRFEVEGRVGVDDACEGVWWSAGDQFFYLGEVGLRVVGSAGGDALGVGDVEGVWVR